MKWLEANPVGMTLAVSSGVLVVLGLLTTILWTLPISVSIDESASNGAGDIIPIVVAGEIGELRQYEIINQKPVFNESRLPVIEAESEELVEEEDDTAIAVADAPDVKLTGIIITPGMKLASLTPNDANIESVMAYEGDSLNGEFVGWYISKVSPRNVVLESRDGRSLELELEVHKSKIQAPIKPVAKDKVAAAAPAEQDKSPATSPAAAASDEDQEPISRAEQIRQRIAERREELRRQQEESNKQAGKSSQTTNTNAYQNALRAKMIPISKDKSSDDSKDG